MVTSYIQSGAWFAHPEAVLVSLLASPVAEDRKFAVDQIFKVTPFLKMDATMLTGLIDWEADTVHEPVFSCSLSKAELHEVLAKPLLNRYRICRPFWHFTEP